jgi:hypothetical protein
LQKSIERFINLANEMKEGGGTPEMVSAAMMTASALYATYSVAGNEGGLTESGVDKVVAKYRDCVEYVQEVKKKEFGKA